jgi:hypothetical protein
MLDADVLVAGGGPAGVGAAIAAARDGAKVLLVERGNCLGGLATGGLVPAWAPLGDGRQLVIRGLALDIIDEMKSLMPHIPPDRYDWVGIDAEVLKRILDRRVTAAGASVLFHTQFADAATHDRRVAAAVVCNKRGLSILRARFFIDGTGDADLAVRAGARYESGDPRTGELQPVTLCFTMTGMDTAAFIAWREARPNRQNVRDAVARAKAAGDLHIPEGHITSYGHVSPHAMGFNFSHLFDVDGTDPAHVSRAEIEGRQLVAELAAFLRKYCPGCERATLAATGTTIGVRETRRIVGEYRLTIDDYLARRSFDDEIARNAYYIDVHGSKAEMERQASGAADWHEAAKPYGPGESHGIPYRCLIPKGLRNVLVAGRCLSADRYLQGACRCMPHCVAMGEAAGAAAALAVRHDIDDVRQVDIRGLRDTLRRHGAYLP